MGSSANNTISLNLKAHPLIARTASTFQKHSYLHTLVRYFAEESLMVIANFTYVFAFSEPGPR